MFSPNFLLAFTFELIFIINHLSRAIVSHDFIRDYKNTLNMAAQAVVGLQSGFISGAE